MTSRAIGIIAAVAVGLGVCGCGDNQRPTPPFNHVLGGSAGAPLVRGTVDRAILQDPATYQPAKFGTRGGASDALETGGGGADSGNTEPEVREFVDKFVAALSSRRVEEVLKSFVPEDIAALEQNASALYEAAEKEEALESALIEKFGEASVTEYKAQLQATHAAYTVEVLDGSNANISPNLLMGLLGPTAGAVMSVKRTDEGWRIRLPAPLTAEDVAAITQVQNIAKAAVDLLIDKLAAGEIGDIAQVAPAAMQAAAEAARQAAGAAAAPTEEQPAGEPPAEPEEEQP